MRHRYTQQSQLFDFREGVGGSGMAVSPAVARWNGRQKVQHQYTPGATHLDKAVEVLHQWVGSTAQGEWVAPEARSGRMALPLPYESPADLFDAQQVQVQSLNKDPSRDVSPRESLLSEDATPAPHAADDYYDHGSGRDEEVPPTSFGRRPLMEERGVVLIAEPQPTAPGENVGSDVSEEDGAVQQQLTPFELLRLAVSDNVLSHTPQPNRNYPDIVPKSHRQLRWDIQHGQASLHSYSAKITALPPPQVMAERMAAQQQRRIVSHAELKRAVASHRVSVDA